MTEGIEYFDHREETLDEIRDEGYASLEEWVRKNKGTHLWSNWSNATQCMACKVSKHRGNKNGRCCGIVIARAKP